MGLAGFCEAAAQLVYLRTQAAGFGSIPFLSQLNASIPGPVVWEFLDRLQTFLLLAEFVFIFTPAATF